MKEFIPLALGVPLGLVASSIAARTRWLVIVAGSLVLGVLTSATVGELEESWAFALVDTAQVMFATVAVMLLRERLERTAPSRDR